ncbi:MAG: SsrA-binding protein SmpB [Alphaproteobacteria bacterium]|nr:SsrA-binding protein SmpB [Alphaproteobacteria bacterium]MBO7537575.1 SsrA-binding protein SmpB [Alphaproteobacteria bacterium]MBO7641601.1 SsrA-binding protein SmpB [Alphaproteobacteria bacterium]
MSKYKEIGVNRKAHYDYEIIDTLEAGIVLFGTEVKSLRSNKVNLTDSYAGLTADNEVFLYQMGIPKYSMANLTNHEPKRNRKLLLKKREIQKLIGALKKSGYSLIPLKIYFNEKGFVKISLGLGKGKKNIDKRETIKEREWNREKSRILKNSFR